MDSILTSVKKLLGIAEEQTAFDPDLIVFINTALATLTHLGVGPSTGFSIEDDEAVWDDFISAGQLLDMVKSYVYLKVRLLFDPPTSSAVSEALNNNASELEWRINSLVDPGSE